jgi:hypothetical protein
MTTREASVRSDTEISEVKERTDEEFDRAVERRFLEAIEDSGLDGGEGELDKDLLVDKLYEVLSTKRVVEIGVNDDRYSPETSSTKDELTQAIFIKGPTAAQAEESAVMKKVYEKCQATVWNLLQPSRRGRVQQRLEADKLLLIRGKVFRHGNPIETGVYVSTHEEVVLRELLGPQLAKLRKLTEGIEDDFKMATERSRALEAPLRAAIEMAMQEATAKLPGLALGSGDREGQKAIEG